MSPTPDARLRALPGLAALALALSACADLAMEPDQIPSALSIAPKDTLITQGAAAQLRITVLDQDGEPMDGYPSWAPPRWSISDPSALAISSQGLMDGLAGGEVVVDAALAGMEASFRVRVNPKEVGLNAPTVYLVQSIQNPKGTVPLVAGRDAFLRVFMTGDRTSFYQPRVRATFYRGDQVVHTALMLPQSDLIPNRVEERRLDRSYNAVIPASVIQPGLEMVVHLDPDAVVPLAPGSAVRVPTEGRRRLDVREVAPMEITVVPTMLTLHPDIRVFNWTGGMNAGSREIALARAVHPVGDLRIIVRDTFHTDADLTTEAGWNSYLREIRALRILEGSRGYWYGTAQLPRGSAWGGLGYIGYPASVGAPSASTFAHELGHNLNLRHAPCGGVASSDPLFPHDGGSIGVYGYDFGGGSGLGGVVDPGEFKDLMGYCSPRWVSDYHFDKALAFRLTEEELLVNGPTLAAPSPGRALLLWGSAGDAGLLLEPTFAVDAPPALPEEDGPYRLEGFDASGRRLFALRFAPQETSEGDGHFAFAVPAGPEWEAVLDRIVLTGPRGAVTQERSATRRAALVADAGSGRVRAIVRDWSGNPRLEVGRSVLLSDGLPLRGTEGGMRR